MRCKYSYYLGHLLNSLLEAGWYVPPLATLLSRCLLWLLAHVRLSHSTSEVNVASYGCCSWGCLLLLPESCSRAIIIVALFIVESLWLVLVQDLSKVWTHLFVRGSNKRVLLLDSKWVLLLEAIAYVIQNHDLRINLWSGLRRNLQHVVDLVIFLSWYQIDWVSARLLLNSPTYHAPVMAIWRPEAFRCLSWVRALLRTDNFIDSTYKLYVSAWRGLEKCVTGRSAVLAHSFRKYGQLIVAQ